MLQGPAFHFDHLGIQRLLNFKYFHQVLKVTQCDPSAFLVGIVQSADCTASTLAFISALHYFHSWPGTLPLRKVVRLRTFQIGTKHVQK